MKPAAKKKENLTPDFTDIEESTKTTLTVESEIIASILLNPPVFPSIKFILSSEDFQSNTFSTIFDSISEIASSNSEISTISLVKNLQKNNRLSTIGGIEFINQLTDSIPSTQKEIVEEKARYILEQSKIRKASKLSDRFKTISSVNGLIDLTKEIESTLNYQPDFDIPEFIDGLESCWNEFNEIREYPTKRPSIPFGFTGLDELLGGLVAGRIYLIGARPSVGKTALASRIARNVSQTKPVVFFSLEMPKKEIIDRLICQEAGISHKLFTVGETPDHQLDQLTNSLNILGNYKLFIDDSAPQTLNDLTVKSNRIKDRFGEIGLIVIDYIQLVRSDRKELNSVEEIKEVSRGFKILAKKLNCPILLLAQLNRESTKPSFGNKQEDLEPQLHHLKGSGDLEQDCDVCILLDRPELRNPTIKDMEGKALAYIRKNRHGEIGTIPLNYNKLCGRFEELL